MELVDILTLIFSKYPIKLYYGQSHFLGKNVSKS